MSKPIVTIEIDGAESQRAAERIPGLMERMKANLKAANVWSAREVMKEVTLTGRIPFKTGTLRRSFSIKPQKQLPGSFETSVGTKLGYAPVLEFGFDGTIKSHMVRAHQRTVAFGKVVNPFTVGPYQVGAYHLTRRARPYIRPGIQAAIPRITSLHKEAAEAAIKGQAF